MALIFISNTLINPNLQRELGIPLEFITFAHIEGKMYRFPRSDECFVVREENKAWGNNVVYGAIFFLRDYEFYIRQLDAYHSCSLTTLGRNHRNDLTHRKQVIATPISFDTVDELERLKYVERNKVDVITYIGNINHPKINQRLTKTTSYRVIDGVNYDIRFLIREVLQ